MGGKGEEVGVEAPFSEGVEMGERVSRGVGVGVKSGALGDSREVGVDLEVTLPPSTCREEGDEEGVGMVGEMLAPLDTVGPPTEEVGVEVKNNGVTLGDPDKDTFPGVPHGVEVEVRVGSRDTVPPPPTLVPVESTEALPPPLMAVSVALGLGVPPEGVVEGSPGVSVGEKLWEMEGVDWGVKVGIGGVGLFDTDAVTVSAPGVCVAPPPTPPNDLVGADESVGPTSPPAGEGVPPPEVGVKSSTGVDVPPPPITPGGRDTVGIKGVEVAVAAPEGVKTEVGDTDIPEDTVGYKREGVAPPPPIEAVGALTVGVNRGVTVGVLPAEAEAPPDALPLPLPPPPPPPPDCVGEALKAKEEVGAPDSEGVGDPVFPEVGVGSGGVPVAVAAASEGE